MKRIGKMLAFLLAVVMILTTALSMTAFAAPTGDTTNSEYTITIGNGVAGESYYAYKVLDVTLADTDPQTEGYEAFSYSITTDNRFFDTVTGHKTGDDYVDTYITPWGMTFTKSANFTEDHTYVLTAPTEDMSGVDAVGLAAAIGAYVLKYDADHSDADGSIESYSASANEITVGTLGYYFVDTSLGSLCSLDTTATDVTIYEKNSVPSIEKEVKDHDEAEDTYAKAVDVHGGDQVDYRLTVNTGTNEFWEETDDPESPEKTGVDANYVIVDELPGNVVMIPDSSIGDPTNVVVTITDEARQTWGQDTDYTAVYDATTNKLTITLIGTAAANKLRLLGQDKDITIIYSATVTDTAENDTALTNTASLTYKSQSSDDSANVYTWSFDALKYTGELGETLEETTKLPGAVFQLLNSEKNTMLLISEGSNIYRYDSRIQKTILTDGTATITDPDDSAKNITVVDSITTDATGAFKIKSLDSGTYYLHETAAPDGYNILQSDIEVEITATEDAGTMTHTVEGATSIGDTAYITIENKTGTVLPSTGGMGTTLFYVIGAILVIGAGVLLVVRRRMNDR